MGRDHHRVRAWLARPVETVVSGRSDAESHVPCSSLDTLLLLDLPAEFSLAREHVRQLSFGIINGASWMNGQVPHGEKAPREPQLGVFETTIRCVSFGHAGFGPPLRAGYEVVDAEA